MVRRDLDREFGNDLVRIGWRQDRDLLQYIQRRRSISFFLFLFHLECVSSLARAKYEEIP